jgi:5-methyltetrahydrofolate--homocysteine methyltransferase
MTIGDTTVRSATRDVVIGPSRPVAVIGERINPTGRTLLTQAYTRGDTSVALRDALAQVDAGATILDVNVGVPGLDQPALMAKTVRALQEATDVPLCLDSADPRVLEAGLAAYAGKAMVNSVTGEEHALEGILPLVHDYGAAIIALPIDGHGIPDSAEARLRVAERIIEYAVRLGIAPEDVILDPLTMAVGADTGAGRVTLDTVALLSEQLGANITLGVSNVSHGLPARPALNAAFVAMAIARGATCPIVNPLDSAMMAAVRAANLCLGHDQWAAEWIRAFRAARPGTRTHQA